MPRSPHPTLLATVIVAAALAWFTLTHVAGGGGTDMTTEIRAVNPFHRLEISGRADVSLVEGPSESVTIDATARGQPRVLARVEGGTLMIAAGDSRRWWNALIGGRTTATPRITVQFKSLDTIAVSGSIKLAAEPADENPRALIIAAPRCCTVAMKSSFNHFSSPITSFAGRLSILAL